MLCKIVLEFKSEFIENALDCLWKYFEIFIDRNLSELEKSLLRYPEKNANFLADELNNSVNELMHLWKHYIEMIHSHLGRLFFQTLLPKARKQFLKEEFTRWNTYLVGIPIANLELIHDIFSSGMTIEATGLRSVRYQEENQKFVLEFIDDSSQEVDYLINATGYGKDPVKHQAPYAVFLIWDDVSAIVKDIQNGMKPKKLSSNALLISQVGINKTSKLALKSEDDNQENISHSSQSRNGCTII